MAKQRKQNKKHVLEELYPQQCKEYKDTIESLHQLFLDKGREYGVGNVRAMGQLGLSLRMLEKIERVLHLLGWDTATGSFKKAVKDIKFDSVDAEYRDIANIAIIAGIVAKGKWAK